MEALRVLLVDDNDRFLAAARSLLEGEGIVVAGVASTGDEALACVDELDPDVALVDVDLGAESGFDVARLLAGRGPHDRPAVVLISTYSEDDLGELVDASEAVGFVSKSALGAEAIHDVLARGGRAR